MNNLKISFVLVLFSLTIFSAGCGHSERNEAMKKFSFLNPGRDFTLMDQNSQEFHLKDYRGQSILLFFGYLSCPDVCPTTLAKLARVYKLLGNESEKILTVFVTVDPQRDTSVKLKEYLEYFKVRSIGLTGSQDQVDQVVKSYGASYEKVDIPGKDYLMNHSDYIYLIDNEGRVAHLFRTEDDAKSIVNILKKHM